MAENRAPYDNFLPLLSQTFERRLEEIRAGHNFDNGPEFEIAVGKVIDSVLPDRFGVCRGYIVCETGTRAGDDIIIYDQMRFPTLGLREDHWAQKEFIPVEAVYAYIEVKHTLVLGDPESGQSIEKACRQVEAAKNLPREEVPLGTLSPYFKLPYEAITQEGMPKIANQMLGAIISRNVSFKGTDLTEDGKSIRQKMAGYNLAVETAPDLIVAGPNCVSVPCVVAGQKGTYQGPFMVKGECSLGCRAVPGQAFGIGLASIAFAVEMMQLGRLSWEVLIGTAMGLREIEDDED